MISPISSNRPIVDDKGVMTGAFRLFVVQLQDNALIIGTGSPEGVVTAIQGVQYMDDAGTSGSILYVKRDTDIAGDYSKGWILV